MIICLHDNYEGSHDHLSVAILAQVYYFSPFFFSCQPFFAMPAMKAMKALKAMKFLKAVMKAKKAKKAMKAAEAQAALWALRAEQSRLWWTELAAAEAARAIAEELEAAEDEDDARTLARREELADIEIERLLHVYGDGEDAEAGPD